MLKPRLEKFYEKVVCEDFILLYNFKNISQIPTFERAILNSTSNKFISSRFSILQSFCAWFLGTNQKGVSTRARKSIALFGIRQNNLLGLKVTLRGKSLFSFFDKLLLFVLPKVFLSSRVANEKNTNRTNKIFLCDFYTISNKKPLYFPEISQLLNFFDSLSGFSLLCSLKISHKSYFPKQFQVENLSTDSVTKLSSIELCQSKINETYKAEATSSKFEKKVKKDVCENKTNLFEDNKFTPFHTRAFSEKVEKKKSMYFKIFEDNFLCHKIAKATKNELKVKPFDSTSILINERKKVLLSAFQLPIYFKK